MELKFERIVMARKIQSPDSNQGAEQVHNKSKLLEQSRDFHTLMEVSSRRNILEIFGKA